MMVDSCPNCGSTEFRDTLSGLLCANCSSKVGTTSPEVLSQFKDETQWIDVDETTTRAGDFDLNSPDLQEALALHEQRPQINQDRDEQRRARITTDVDKWKNDPNSFDFPGVDTPVDRPEARKKDEPFVDTDKVFSNIFDS